MKIYYALNKTKLGHKDIDIEVKIKMYIVATIPVVTYAYKNWTPLKKDETKINTINLKI